MSDFYKIYILDGARRISLAYDFVGPDDSGTLCEAKKHSAEHDVEVWQGSRIVARIARDARAARG